MTEDWLILKYPNRADIVHGLFQFCMCTDATIGPKFSTEELICAQRMMNKGWLDGILTDELKEELNKEITMIKAKQMVDSWLR